MLKNNIELQKKNTAKHAIKYIKDDLIIGLGTGSTVEYTIHMIGEMVKNGLKTLAVSTSHKTTVLASSLNIPLTEINDVDHIDITIDGADEVDEDLNLIKGGGGALLIEKIVASISRQLIITVDKTKVVNKLGAFPLPVEVMRLNYKHIIKRLETLGMSPRLRMNGNNPVVTDNNNFIIDLFLHRIDNPSEIEKTLNMIPGIIENGLFINMADIIIVDDGIYKVKS